MQACATADGLPPLPQQQQQEVPAHAWAASQLLEALLPFLQQMGVSREQEEEEEGGG